MDSVNVWNMDVSEGMAIMASNYSIIYKGSQWAMHKGTDSSASNLVKNTFFLT